MNRVFPIFAVGWMGGSTGMLAANLPFGWMMLVGLVIFIAAYNLAVYVDKENIRKEQDE